MRENIGSFEAEGIDEERIRDILSEDLQGLMAHSRDQHGCPDFTLSLDAISTAVASVCLDHPAFQDRFSHQHFTNLAQAIEGKLSETISRELFANNNQRLFMIHAWSGALANHVINSLPDS